MSNHGTMYNRDLVAGAHCDATWIVQPTDLASVLAEKPGESFPEVLSTSRMLALMELAATRTLAPHLEPGQESVGVTVNITHTAATPPGARVTARATYKGRVGKFYEFEVVANDEVGEIGRGTHQRAVVDTRRLVEGAKRRRN